MRENPHAAFDVAGAGDVAWSRWCDGVDGAPNGIERAKMVVVKTHQKGSRPWASLSRAVVCHACWSRSKNVFQVHGVDAKGEVVMRRKLRRGALSHSSPSLRPASWRWRHAPRRITGGELLAGSGTRSG